MFLIDVNSFKLHKKCPKIYQTIIESNVNIYVKKGELLSVDIKTLS